MRTLKRHAEAVYEPIARMTNVITRLGWHGRAAAGMAAACCMSVVGAQVDDSVAAGDDEAATVLSGELPAAADAVAVFPVPRVVEEEHVAGIGQCALP